MRATPRRNSSAGSLRRGCGGEVRGRFGARELEPLSLRVAEPDAVALVETAERHPERDPRALRFVLLADHRPDRERRRFDAARERRARMDRADHAAERVEVEGEDQPVARVALPLERERAPRPIRSRRRRESPSASTGSSPSRLPRGARGLARRVSDCRTTGGPVDPSARRAPSGPTTSNGNRPSGGARLLRVRSARSASGATRRARAPRPPARDRAGRRRIPAARRRTSAARMRPARM